MSFVQSDIILCLRRKKKNSLENIWEIRTAFPEMKVLSLITHSHDIQTCMTDVFDLERMFFFLKMQVNVIAKSY